MWLNEFFGLEHRVETGADGAERRIWVARTDSILTRLGVPAEDETGSLTSMIGEMQDVTVGDLIEQAADAGRYSFRVEV